MPFKLLAALVGGPARHCLNHCFLIRLVSAFHDRQLRGRLAYRDDLAEDLPDHDGVSNMCSASDSWTLSVRVVDETGEQSRWGRIKKMCTVRRALIFTDVPAALLNLQSDVTT